MYQTRHRLQAVVWTALIAAVLVLGGQVAPARAEIVVLSDQSKHAGEFVVPINKSQVLRLDVPLADLLVGNPEIADVLALTDRSIYVLGKSVGSTSLTIYGKEKALIAVLDLIVSLDADGLKARLNELFPSERVEVRPVANSLVLSGKISSASRLSRILAIAERFAPGGQLTNLMSVAGSQQVMLEVKFVEMSRNKSKDIGLNTQISNGNFAFTSGDVAFQTAAAQLAGLLLFPAGTFAATAVSGDIGGFNWAILADFLESKGVLKILAEPNLIALSGDTANFLAGGEFPIVVEQDDETLIEFKEFGVSLSFTPTVLEDGLMHIIVSPEVSQIDPAFATQTAAGLQVSGLVTRRATTTVELRDGQSFAIAGLIQSNFADTIRQVPGIGDIPILGALFRSSDFQQNETELVILVTPHLVKPAPAGSLATPADNFIPPSDFDLFLFGQTEAPGSGFGRASAGHSMSAEAPGSSVDHTLSAQSAGGIDGAYGHIIK